MIKLEGLANPKTRFSNALARAKYHLLGNCYKISRCMSLYPWRGANSVFRGTTNIANTWVWFAKPHFTEMIKCSIFYFVRMHQQTRVDHPSCYFNHVSVLLCFWSATILQVRVVSCVSISWLHRLPTFFSNLIYWMWDGGSKRNYALEPGTLMPLYIFVLTGWPRLFFSFAAARWVVADMFFSTLVWPEGLPGPSSWKFVCAGGSSSECSIAKWTYGKFSTKKTWQSMHCPLQPW